MSRFWTGILIAGVLAGPVLGEDQVLEPGNGVPAGSVAPSSSTRTIPDIDELDAPVQMVEHEFDPSILEDLATPATPPPQVKLPPLVVTKDEWRGSLCGITRASHAVIRNGALWDKLWTVAIRPYSTKLPETPAIDFNREMVVAVFMGEDLAPGSQIEIISARPDRSKGDTVLLVRYRNNSKMRAVFAPPFAVQPFHIMRVPAFPGRVVFQES
jgi:hypothetical protein